MSKKTVRMIPIVRWRRAWYALSAVVLLASVALVVNGGLKLGIDFAGGTLHEVTFSGQRPAPPDVVAIAQPIVGEVTVQPSDSANAILRYPQVSNETRQQLLDTLTEQYGQVSEARFESIGPTIGNELKRKAFYGIGLVVLGIVLYLTYAFRKVSRPVQSWKYGILAIVTIIHDVGIVVGFAALLGLIRGAQVDSLFLIALLTTLGYSVHDTIVVFDRTRANLLTLGSEQFEKAVSLATNQTLARSINTSLTTSVPLVALLLFGGSTLTNFVVFLLVGVIAGTYSSIFVSSPLLVTWYRLSERRRLRGA